MLNSDSALLTCPVCNNSYKTSTILRVHLNTHSGVKPHQCDLCTKSFALKQTLENHRRTHTGEKPYKCGECFKEFSRRDKLTQHLTTHMNHEVKCDICGKTFSSERKLRNHSLIHSGERTFKCDMCDSAFVCANYLSGHKRKVHNVKNVLYQCSTCGKRFKNSRGVRSHQITHSTDRPYVCHLCPVTFKQSASLKEHLRRHVCEKPFICKVCCKGFSSSATLSEHRYIHLGIKRFQCEKCGKHFTRQHHLHVHSFSHSTEKQFACKYCGKLFRYKNGLRVHIRTHTGLRPYTCDLCGWSFSQRSRMRSHRLTHTGEKPFVCIACGKAFCRHDKLTDHCRRMHKQMNVTGAHADSSIICDEKQDGSMNSICEYDLTPTGIEKGNDTAADVMGITSDAAAAAEFYSRPIKNESIDTFDTRDDSRGVRSKPSMKQPCVSVDGGKLTETQKLQNGNTGIYCTRSGRSYGRCTNSVESRSRPISRQAVSGVLNQNLGTSAFPETDSVNFVPKYFDEEDNLSFQNRENKDFVKDGNTAPQSCMISEMFMSKDMMGEKVVTQLSGDETNGNGSGFTAKADFSNLLNEENSIEEVNDALECSDDESTSGFTGLLPKDFSLVSDNQNNPEKDEDFLFAMRVFGLLKTRTSGHHKNLVKAKIKKMLEECNEDAT